MVWALAGAGVQVAAPEPEYRKAGVSSTQPVWDVATFAQFEEL
jgi:hypothetical protein